MDHYMDDLFGDGPVQLPQLPVIKQLSQRLNELSTTNACQKIDWSRYGVIACIAPDGLSIGTYVLICNRKTAEWKLSSPLPVPIPTKRTTYTIQHVIWSYFGNELAIIDSCGRIDIYSTAGVLGKLVLTRSGESKGESESELNGVVGAYWPPPMSFAKKSPGLWTATKNGNNWSYLYEKVASKIGVYNPIDKQNLLLTITRMGHLRALYQSNQNGHWNDITVPLEIGTQDLNYAITHAAFAPCEDQICFIATYDKSHRLRVYRAKFSWGPVANHDSGVSEAQLKILVHSLAYEENCQPDSILVSDQDIAFATPRPALTYLAFLPVVQTAQMKQPLPPTVMAIYTPVSPANTMVMDPTNQYHSTNSTICQWIYKEQGPEMKLLPVFDLLNPQQTKIPTSSLPPQKDPCLERQPDHHMQALVLSVDILRNNTMFAFSLSDGSIEFRFRESFELASADGNHEEVHTFQQTGFVFPSAKPGLHVALSPNSCCAAVMYSDGKVKHKAMEYVSGDLLQLKDDEPQFGSVAALMGLSSMAAWASSHVTDDIMATLPKGLSQTFKDAIVESVWIAAFPQNAGLAIFESLALQQAYTNQFLLKCFSMQRVLGSGPDNQLTLSAKLAWLALNLKFLSFVAAQSANFPKDPTQIRLDPLLSLQGCIRWLLDTIAFVFQDIFDLNYVLKSNITNISAVTAYIKETQTPALFLLLSSSTRFYFRSAINSLRKLVIALSTIATGRPSAQIASIISRLNSVFVTSPVAPFLSPKSTILEDYIKNIDTLHRQAYTSNPSTGSSTPNARLAQEEHERAVFIHARIPSILEPVLLNGILAPSSTLLSNLNPGALYRHDVSWLGLTTPRSSASLLADTLATYIASTGSPTLVDVVRKWPLSGTGVKRTKTCPRCRSVAEDLEMGEMNAALTQVLIAAGRQCVCMNMWCAHEERRKEKEGKKDEDGIDGMEF